MEIDNKTRLQRALNGHPGESSWFPSGQPRCWNLREWGVAWSLDDMSFDVWYLSLSTEGARVAVAVYNEDTRLAMRLGLKQLKERGYYDGPV